jgi:methyl-accepting chemotaxis protein
MPSFLFKISGRLYAGFGALVLIVVALAGFGVSQLSSIQGQVGKMTALSANTVRTLEVAGNLHAIRRAILRYNFDADEPSYKEAGERETATVELLKAAGKATLSEDRRKSYATLETNVVGLRGKREELGDAIHKLTAARTSLFSVGDELSAASKKLVDAARASADRSVASAAVDLNAALLAVRVANWRFLATRDPKGVAIFKDAVETAQHEMAALEKLDLSDAEKVPVQSIKKALAGYLEAFASASASMIKGDELYRNEVRALTTGSLDIIKTVDETLQRDLGDTKSQTDATIGSSITTQEIAAGLAFLAGILIAFFIGRSISKPLSGLTSGMQELAEGNFGVVLPGLGRKDEVGDMAQAVETFKVKAEQKAREEAEAKMQQDQAAAAQRKRDMIKLADDFEGAVGEIIETVSSASTELEASAGTLTATAERAQEVTTMVAAASEEASTNVQSVASATEEMASSVNEISRQVQTSSNIASEAVNQARKTNDRVGELAQAASRIGDVVELINTIAGQTNLLALNATIEAARAGEAGRGFAVVASEVKALAEQTAKATGEISQQITGIQAATQDSVAAIKEIGDTIGRMSEIASTIAAAVEEQGAATQEISRNVQQAAQGTQQVSSNITDVQRGATETGSASSQVLSAAQSLSRDSNRLRTEVGKFLDTVRAA